MKTLSERLSEKAARNQIPIMSAFELLPICNLQCKMCYVRKSKKEVEQAGGLKDAKWWLSLAKEARDCGLLYPLITGGEPFLHPQFREILAGMLDMGLQVSINSNGTMINREMAIFLSKHRPIRINITMYGASEESYEDLCGDGKAFKRLREGVALLKEYHIPVKFNASITAENYHDLKAIIDFAKEQGCPIQIATYMFPPIRRDSTSIGKNNRLSPEGAALARVQADFWQNEPEWFVGQALRYKQFVPLEKLSFDKVSEVSMPMTCRAGLCSAWIDWQGNMINCGMYGSAKSSLENKSFFQAWKELVEDTRNVRFAPYCAECPNHHLCHPCIAMISNECGDLNGRPEYMCEMNQALSHYYNEFLETYYADRKEMLLKEFIPVESDICEL